MTYDEAIAKMKWWYDPNGMIAEVRQAIEAEHVRLEKRIDELQEKLDYRDWSEV